MIIKSMSVKTEKNKLTSLPIEEQEAIEEFIKLYGKKVDLHVVK